MRVVNFRHQDEIELRLTIDPDDQAIYIPPFILQPVLENAVVHAFDGRSKGHWISIHAYLEKDVLYILISDNGRGMS